MPNVCMIGHGMMGIWHSEALQRTPDAVLHTVVGRAKPASVESNPTAWGKNPTPMEAPTTVLVVVSITVTSPLLWLTT